jgi:FixJ family two-component response regulator
MMAPAGQRAHLERLASRVSRLERGVSVLELSPVIAIVDDDPGVQGSLDSLLRSVGLISLKFSSAEALLGAGLESQLACIITDLHMPGMTGLELQAEILRRGWAQPLIMLTAYPTDIAREQALAAGAAAFVTKPIDPDLLLEAIQALVC